MQRSPDADEITETTAVYSYGLASMPGLRQEFDQHPDYRFVPHRPREPEYRFDNPEAGIEVTMDRDTVRFRQYQAADEPITDDIREGLYLERIELGSGTETIRYEPEDDLSWDQMRNTQKTGFVYER